MQFAIATSTPDTTTAAIAAVGTRRNAANAKFANDGSFESVQRMLEKFAFKALKRCKDMGLGWEFEDVMAQLRLGYVQARNKWNPQGGALFSTYCMTVCRNNFNNAIEKEETERRELGMVSYDDLVGTGDEAGFEDSDPLEFLAASDDAEMSTEDSMIAREEFFERMQGMTPNARKLITALLQSERIMDREPAPKLRDLAVNCGLVGDELKRVKQEILAKFGVRWI